MLGDRCFDSRTSQHDPIPCATQAVFGSERRSFGIPSPPSEQLSGGRKAIGKYSEERCVSF